MVYSLMYRGETMGEVTLRRAALPPGLVARHPGDDGEWHTGWLTPTTAYVTARSELTGLTRETAAMTDGPELAMEEIRSRLRRWQELYAANGLELRDEAGRPLPAEALTINDSAAPDDSVAENPLIIVTVKLRRPAT
jgi:hypothetical protein